MIFSSRSSSTSPTAPHDRQVKLDAERISLQLVDELPDALADALEVATYVFVADRLIRRGSNASRRIGSDWQRRIRFRIPVRRLDLWTRDDVGEALTDLLTFLSEDRLVFEFSRATRPVAPEPSLGFRDRAAQKIRPDQVILFSGGLDSLAGVCEAVVGAGNSAILVTHKSSKTIASRQDALAEALASRTRSGQLLYAPLWVQRGAIKPMEHSQRLRSFLFATLGMTYARMFGLDTVHFYENGITSFNLPIAEHVVGTRASRTTHPRVLNRVGRLFSLLLDKPVAFSNPYVWMTKRDIVETIEANGCGDLIAQTVSCAHVRDYSFNGTQCGSCSQCVERRVAIVGAGLSLREPPGTYRSDLFTGPHESGQELTMIEAHIQRAWSLTGMTRADFLASYGQSFRCLRELDGSPEENASRMAMDWAIAVACGGFAMGSISCDQGDVLYVDLENGHRRIKNRINTLFPGEQNRPDLGRLECSTSRPARIARCFSFKALNDRLIVIEFLRFRCSFKASRRNRTGGIRRPSRGAAPGQ
ncbi:7-cyano-7-deazaguanine synthase [Aquibium sp. A9E412]|uniref:7-cyano-7-deazaguanine synthase n=1 Tax=Aquibium sp. A9E412 TaxID=2976767 RepID=UPI0025B042AC|nr:7-cyano-7-deazaguanine synthase [Aquibium sp. A9E412]MDN2565206.1 7-cyano-7-deazaguanine synthase [Aquibium sp. A9E412]